MALLTSLSWKKLAVAAGLIVPMIIFIGIYPFFFPEALQPAMVALSGALGFMIRELFESHAGDEGR